MKYVIEQSQEFIDGIIDILTRNKALKIKDSAVLKKDFSERRALSFEDFLIDEHLVSKAALLKALQEYYNVPAIDVLGHFFEHNLVIMIPKHAQMRYCFIPYARDGNILAVVAANPNHPELSEVIGRYVSYDVTFMVGYFRDIRDAIEEFYARAVTEVPQDIDLRAEREEERALREITEEEDIIK